LKRRNTFKGQVSIELLVIVGFVLAVFIPILFFSYMKSDELKRSTINIVATGVGKKIASGIESIYYSGEGSSLRFLINVPKDISINFTCNCRDCLSGVVMNLPDSSQVYLLTKGCINTSMSDELKEGLYSIKIIYTKEGIIIRKD